MTQNADTENAPRRCSVFLVPAREDRAYLEVLIGEICSRLDLPPFEPHVTVYAGLFDDPAAVQQVLAEIAGGIPPITLRTREIGSAPDYFKTLFIKFEEDSRVAGIHERIKRSCGVQSGYELDPHLSLLYAELPLREKEELAKHVLLDRTTIRFDEIKLVTPLNTAEGWRDTKQWLTLYRAKLAGKEDAPPLRAVLFDFGGVLATEGFREGLQAIARRQGLDPVEVHRLGMDAIYDSGYITGRGKEADFWAMMRERTGLAGTDAELRDEILARFTVRPGMIEAVRRLRRAGHITAILSDQTDWLERLDLRDNFYSEFDRVFNSYRMGKGKRDATIFTDVVDELGISPREALFVDDMPGNVERAVAQGLRGVVFEDEERILAELEQI